MAREGGWVQPEELELYKSSSNMGLGKYHYEQLVGTPDVLN